MLAGNGLVNSANYSILSANCYQNLEAYDTNSYTTIDIADTDYNREAINNHVAKNTFDQNQSQHSSPMETGCSKSTP